ncbi:hypothetical protein CEW46_31235, partial [Bacillus cereus]
MLTKEQVAVLKQIGFKRVHKDYDPDIDMTFERWSYVDPSKMSTYTLILNYTPKEVFCCKIFHASLGEMLGTYKFNIEDLVRQLTNLGLLKKNPRVVDRAKVLNTLVYAKFTGQVYSDDPVAGIVEDTFAYSDGTKIFVLEVDYIYNAATRCQLAILENVS